MGLVLIITFVTLGNTSAYASENIKYNKTDKIYSTDAKLDNKSKEYINKVVSVSKYYYFDNDRLKISLTKEQLINDYNFTEVEYDALNKTILNKKIIQKDNFDQNLIVPYAHVSNGTLYISNSDLQAGTFAVLATADNAGPAAMAAALTAISTAMSGPVGTVLSAIVTVAAAPSLIELCGRVTWALATNKGIYIKPVFSYPPLEIGYY